MLQVLVRHVEVATVTPIGAPGVADDEHLLILNVAQLP